MQHGGHITKDLLGPRGVPVGGGKAFVYLLRDDFLTDAAAPLASPRTCEPGPGEALFYDADSKAYIQSSALRWTSPTGSYKQVYVGLPADTSLVAGKALYVQFSYAADKPTFGWTDKDTPVGFGSFNRKINVISYLDKLYVQIANGVNAPLPQPLNTINDVALILRNGGVYILSKQSGVWKFGYVLYQSLASMPTVLRPFLSSEFTNNLQMAYYSLRSAHLVVNGYNVWGHRDLDTTSESAAPNASDTGTHTADCHVRFTCSAPTGDTELFVRYRDATHYDSIKIDASGNLTYNQANGGSPVALITAAAAISGGETIDVMLNGATVRLWYNGTSAGTTSSATANVSGTTWRLDKEANAVTNLVFRTLDGVANVGSPNHPGYGVATSVLLGPRAVNDTFTHEADCLLEFVVNALPSSGTIDVAFRRQDATHEWLVRINASGDLLLVEDNDGEVTRSTASGVVTAGMRIVVIPVGNVINGYTDSGAAATLRWTYSSATNFATQTSGNGNSLGTGGRISNLTTWPRDLANAPNTPGAAEALRALQEMAR